MKLLRLFAGQQHDTIRLYSKAIIKS